MRELTLGSLFDGSGGFPLAGVLNGIRPVWASEIEPFPIRVTKNRFPNMKHLGSVTDVNGAEVEPVDIITFGSPCFPAGTLVNTADGLKPIENVTVADSVLSHTGVYRQVLDAKYTGTKQIMRLKAMGVHKIDATPNHLFYAKRDDVTRWIPLSELKQGDCIAAPRIQVQENPLCLTMEECWLIGRYIADGYTRIGQRPDRPDGSAFSTVVFCVGAGKELEFESNVKQHAFGKSAMSRNVVKYTIWGSRLTQLCELCGHGAENKHLPVFLLNLPNDLLRKVISGYMSGDGCKTCNVFKATTVSKRLVYTLSQAISKTYGYPCRIYEIPVPETTVIEGRTVNQRTQWQIVFKTDVSVKDKAHSDTYYVWLPVRSVELLEKKEAVYDITVAEDHSFCVQNIAVHNCQDLSVAGKQLGIHDGQRSNLFFEAIRIIKEMRNATADKFPRFAVWENVPGAFSSNKGKDFQAVLQAFCGIRGGQDHIVPLPPKNKWLPFGTIVGDGWSVAWRVYDAQFWGVPQRRKRIYLIADFGSERAGEILSFSEGLCGDFAESGEAREGTAADVEGSAGRGDSVIGCDLYNGQLTGDKAATLGAYSGASANPAGPSVCYQSDGVKCLNPWDCQSKRQYVDGVYRTLDARNCAGGQAHGICYALDSLSSNSMKSANPRSGFHEESVTKTLDTNPDPTCNQGGNVIVQPAAFMGDRGAKARSIAYCKDGTTPTLKSAPSGGNTVPDVVYPINTMVATRGGKDDMRTCFGVGEPNDPQFTISAAHEHAVCFQCCGDRKDPSVSVSEKAYCLPANPMSDRGQSVCYGIDQQGGKGGANYQTNVSPTLCSDSHGTPHAVCFRKSSKPGTDGSGERWVYDEKTNTLNTFEFHSEVRTPEIVCYEGQNVCCDSKKAFTLQSGSPDQQAHSIRCLSSGRLCWLF